MAYQASSPGEMKLKELTSILKFLSLDEFALVNSNEKKWVLSFLVVHQKV